MPSVIREQSKTNLSATTLFLLLWTVLPLVFFSLSYTKLPHYILPIYPPLAILTGTTIAAALKNAATARRWPLSFPAFNWFVVLIMLVIGFFWPGTLPRLLQAPIRNVLHDSSGIVAGATALGLIWFVVSMRRNITRGQASLYLLCCCGFALYFFMAHLIVKFVALDSSSKLLAEKSAPLIGAGDQLVIYDNFRSTVAYYLQITRPMRVVWPGKGASIMESYYIAEKQPQGSTEYGKALLTFDEFARLKETTRSNLFVFVKTKSAVKVPGRNNVAPQKLLEFNDCTVLLIAGSDGDRSQ